MTLFGCTGSNRRLCFWSSLTLFVLMFGASQVVRADNVLLIIADDLGADSVGLFSAANNLPPTPTLDGLAANGVRMTRCWANPICSPSRASLLTGRHGFRTGVGSPGDPINLSEGTVADAFNSAGYDTACIGKWHLSNDSNGGNDNPNLMGFGHYSGWVGGGLRNYFSWTKVINGQTQQNLVNTYGTTENVNDAIAWIDDHDQNDWFLWLAFNAPHDPFHLPPNNLHSYNLSGTEADIAANRRDYYHASVEAMDTEIGRLISTIDPTVLADTTIIFVGDNGTPTSVTPRPRVVRGAKGRLWEGGVHVPCIISGPAVSGPLNRTNDAMIHFVDFFKTMLEMAAIDPNIHTPAGAATDSRSFAGLLADPSLPNPQVCQFAIRFANPTVATDGQTIASDLYKLIRYDDGNEEFFHRADEFSNLLDIGLNGMELDSYNDLVRKMEALVDPPKVVSLARDAGSIDRPDLINLIEIVFNQDVGVTVAELLLENDTVQQPVDSSGAVFTYDANTFTATWDFSALASPLEAAFYSLELISANISSLDDNTELDGDGDGLIGPSFEQSLQVAIPGDANLDGVVDVLNDAFTLIANLNLAGSTSWSQGDFDADGEVNVLGDAFVLVANLGRTIQP